MNQYDKDSGEKVYLPEEIAQILRISKRGAYNLCDHAPFRVLKFGGFCASQQEVI